MYTEDVVDAAKWIGACFVWLCGLVLPTGWGHLLCLMVQVPVGVLVYVLTIHYFKVEAYIETLELLREQCQKGRVGANIQVD